MITNEIPFLRSLRTALGKPADEMGMKNQLPHLFSSPDSAATLERICNRTRRERLALIDILEENGRAINLQTHVVESSSQAADVIIDLIRSKNPEFSHTKHVIMHDHPDIAQLALWKRFTREAVTTHITFSSDPQLREKTCASFIGITAPCLGVADSATVIEVTIPGRPRSTSLVPSIHIALLRRERLVADLDEAFALLTHEGLPGSFVCISGPSKTADIEAHMVYGAHGPREMHLVLLSEPAAIQSETPAAPLKSVGSADGEDIR